MKKLYVNIVIISVILSNPDIYAQVPGYVPTSGLRGWWSFDNNANDATSYNAHGTVFGATLTTDRLGNPNAAYLFDGVNDYILIGDPVPAHLQIQNEITLSAWIYATSYPASNTLGLIVGSQCDGCGGKGATIFLDGRTNPDGQTSPPGHIHFQIGNGSWNTSNANAQVPLNEWVNITATRKSGEVGKIYYNGVLQPLTSVAWTGAIHYAGAFFAMGRQKDISNRYFNGKIDDVGIWSRALDECEVVALYQSAVVQSPLPAYIPQGQLAAYWSYDCNAYDSGPNEIHGTVHGANLVDDRFGNANAAYQFDGVNDWIDFGDDADLNPGLSDMSVNAWIKTSSNAGQRIYAKGTHGGPQPGYDLMIYPDNTGRAALIWGANGYERRVYSNNPVNDNQWHMLSGVFDRNGNIALYVDGVLQSEQYIGETAGISIGAGTYNAASGASFSNMGNPGPVTEFFNGSIDEVVIWKRELLDCEIQSIYNQSIVAPIVICQPTLTVNNTPGQCWVLASSIPIVNPTITSNCGVATITNNFNSFQTAGVIYPGTYTLNWEVTDVAGNSSTCSQLLVVNDVTPPTIICPADFETTTFCGPATVNLTNPFATDNCGGVISFSNNHPSNIFPVGNTLVTWTATDAAGNSSTCTQTVKVYSPEAQIAGGTGFVSVIPNGFMFYSTFNGTDYGSVPICSPYKKDITYQIKNVGTSPLSLTGTPRVQLSGANASEFLVLSQPPAGTVLAPGATANFIVRFDPASSPGTYKYATITVPNNDCDESTYNYGVRGLARLCPSAPNEGDDNSDVEYSNEDDNILDESGAILGDENRDDIIINLYPNPSDGNFTITISELTRDAEIRIMDALGKMVYAGKMTSTMMGYDMSYLRAGTYYVQIVTERGSVTKQIIITQTY